MDIKKASSVKSLKQLLKSQLFSVTTTNANHICSGGND